MRCSIGGRPRSAGGPTFLLPAAPAGPASFLRAHAGLEKGSLLCAHKSLRLPLARINPAMARLRLRKRKILALLVMAFLSRDIFVLLTDRVIYFAAGSAGAGLAGFPFAPGFA